jgi:hypothetical protein
MMLGAKIQFRMKVMEECKYSGCLNLLRAVLADLDSLVVVGVWTLDGI